MFDPVAARLKSRRYRASYKSHHGETIIQSPTQVAFQITLSLLRVRPAIDQGTAYIFHIPLDNNFFETRIFDQFLEFGSIGLSSGIETVTVTTKPGRVGGVCLGGGTTQTHTPATRGLSSYDLAHIGNLAQTLAGCVIIYLVFSTVQMPRTVFLNRLITKNWPILKAPNRPNGRFLAGTRFVCANFRQMFCREIWFQKE